MEKAREDHSVDLDRRPDSALLLSPSSSPDRQQDRIVVFPSSPPPTPTSPHRKGSPPSLRLDEARKMPETSFIRELHSDRRASGGCGGGCRALSPTGERLRMAENSSDCISDTGDANDVTPSSDDVSDSEEVIDVIGDDADVISVDDDVKKDAGYESSKYHRHCQSDGDVSGGDVSGGDVSGEVGSPRSRKDETENEENENSDDGGRRDQGSGSPSSVTNFSIAAILKPDFGQASKVRLDCPPCPASPVHRHNTSNSSSSSPDRSPIHHTASSAAVSPVKPINLHPARFLGLHHNHHHSHRHLPYQRQLFPGSLSPQQGPNPANVAPHPLIHPHIQQQQHQQQIQAHQLLQRRLCPGSPSPVDLSTRGRKPQAAFGHRACPSPPALPPRASNPLQDIVRNTNSVSSHGVHHRGSGDHVSSRSHKPSPADHRGSHRSSGAKERKSSVSSSPPSVAPPSPAVAGSGSASGKGGNSGSNVVTSDNKHLWPAWVFCTRYSDRPSSGPRSRRAKRKERPQPVVDEKRPRTAFTSEQLSRLKREFDDCRYLTETRRRHLASELGLTESQIKIWFQNKRAKLKKSSGIKNELALQLMAQGLYNHSTVPVHEGHEDDDDDVRSRAENNDVMVC